MSPCRPIQQLGRANFGHGQRDGHVGRPIQRRARKLLALREQRSRQLLKWPPEFRVNLPRGHLEIDLGRREASPRKRRVDEGRGGVQEQIVHCAAAAREREGARQRSVEAIVIEPVNLERRGETSGIQPGDVAACRIGEFAVARFDPE